MTNTDTDKINSLLTRRVHEVLPQQSALKQLLQSGKILRIFQGFDPTGSKLHLGHTIGLRNLQQCLELGHEVIVLFGTGTVLVGDPSQRSSQRLIISQEEIEANIQTWKEQVGKIIDLNRATIKQNGDWLIPLTLKDIIKIASNISATQLFKRDSFTKRINQGNTVWFHETFYPLLQGYDSVVMDVDVEFGGTDQTFNMLIGRELQKKINHREKYVVTNPMILGTDGQQMSKSTGNCIWLTDSATDMYGKVMSITDQQIFSYHQLLTNLDPITQSDIVSDPLTHKKNLALDIAAQFHGKNAALEAQKSFQAMIQQKGIPSEIPHVNLKNSSVSLLDLCRLVRVGESSGEIKRVISQGGVEINQTKVTDFTQTMSIDSGDILKYGKRQFYKLITKSKNL